MTDKKTLVRKCPNCGREIFSLYKNQLEQNFETHKKWCIKGKKTIGEGKDE